MKPTVCIVGHGGTVQRDGKGAVKHLPGFALSQPGFALSHSEWPWERDDCEVWGMNALYETYPVLVESRGVIASSGGISAELSAEWYRFDRWFQLHTPEYMAKHWATGWVHHEEWLAEQHSFSIYMQKAYKRYPSSARFPKERVEELPLGRYHLSSFDWMVAFAITEGFERIECWGCNMDSPEHRGEPFGSRACLEYWLGVAAGMGIEIHVEPPSNLFTSGHLALLRSDLQYAYDDEPAFELGEGWRDVR